MSFERFMELALYHPEVGYYRRNHTRVGYGPGTDFFTASTSGPVFGELIVAATVRLLADRGATPDGFTFVEIGAEPGKGVLAGVEHPFRDVSMLHAGDSLRLQGPCVVFSNELFDAQPFARHVRTDQGWSELAVEWDGAQFREVQLPPTGNPPPDLPPEVPAGYVFDAPRSAAALAGQIAREPWHGLFLAFDYGKSFEELATAQPRGTARAYYRHQQSNDLLARPGEQDLTCHVCWDWITQALEAAGFRVAPPQSQEAFLITHAKALLAAQVEADAGRLTRRKLSLMQLLHPAHLGQKFQVLTAWRGPEDSPCTG